MSKRSHTSRRRPWTDEEKREVYKRSGGRCRVCGRKHRLDAHGRTWSIDHVIPFSKGGRNGTYNLALTCLRCNSKRGNKQTVGDVAEVAARRAIRMERNRQGDRHREGGHRSGGSRGRAGGGKGGRGSGSRPLIHVTSLPSLANGRTICGRPANRPEHRQPTCPRCIKGNNFFGALFGA